jgi:hypothetical protein
MVVRAGGPPSTNALILAFVLPLSLFVGTLITAARVADDLDERFLREVRRAARIRSVLKRHLVELAGYCQFKIVLNLPMCRWSPTKR